MNDETLTALEQSIQHWEENLEAIIAKDTSFNIASNSCALCSMFFKQNCKGCPVAIKTGQPFCECTPYVTIALLNNFEDECVELIKVELVKAELNFLKSLLP